MKIDARGWEFQILDRADAPDDSEGTWVEIDGINTFELDPSANEEVTETTKFKSRGAYEGEKMQTGSTVQVEGFWENDDETGERDRGQALVVALHEKVSTESHGTLRFRHETEQEWTVWRKTFVTSGSNGGGNNDKTSFSGTFTRSGRATVMEVAA